MCRFAASMMKELDIEIIKQGMPGITPVIGSYLYENCLVCLNNAGHTDGVNLQVQGLQQDNLRLHWSGEISEQALRSYQDDFETTEQGAICLSVLIAKQLTNYTVVERSWRGTGIDYWLGYDDDPLFQRAARLEISGIKAETPANSIRMRYEQKVNQTRLSDDTELSAYISIIEFSTPKCLFNKKQ